MDQTGDDPSLPTKQEILAFLWRLLAEMLSQRSGFSFPLMRRQLVRTMVCSVARDQTLTLHAWWHALVSRRPIAMPPAAVTSGGVRKSLRFDRQAIVVKTHSGSSGIFQHMLPLAAAHRCRRTRGR